MASFKAGIPRHDTIARVICRLKRHEIEHAFQSWISSLVKIQAAMSLQLTVKLHDVLFLPKIEKVPSYG